MDGHVECVCACAHKLMCLSWSPGGRVQLSVLDLCLEINELLYETVLCFVTS